MARLREGTPAFEWVLTDSVGIPQSRAWPWPQGEQNSWCLLFVCPCKTVLVRLQRGSQHSKVFCMITWSPHCISVSPSWSWESLRGAGAALGTERRCGNVSETSWLPTSLFSQKGIWGNHYYYLSLCSCSLLVGHYISCGFWSFEVKFVI